MTRKGPYPWGVVVGGFIMLEHLWLPTWCNMSVNSQLDNHGMEELQRPFGSDVVMLGVLEVGVANLKIVASKVME